ncbi:MAG: hypothetical protein LBV17_08975 [Treponema sp.]|nr:hypothetical protein [Treponema sp.]
MNDKKKDCLIQMVILGVSFIVTLVLCPYFANKGAVRLAQYSSYLILGPLGVYIIFGKCVYIKGELLTMPKKIVYGLFLILVMPLSFLLWA